MRADVVDGPVFLVRVDDLPRHSLDASNKAVNGRAPSAKAQGQFPVGAEEFPQVHKCAHDVNAHLHCARAVQNGGRHDGAVLGEGVGQVFAVLAATTLAPRSSVET